MKTYAFPRLESNRFPHLLESEYLAFRSVGQLSSQPRLCLQRGLFSSVFNTKPCMHLSFLPYAPRALPISFSILSPYKYSVTSTNSEARQSDILSSLMLFPSSQSHTSPSAPYSRISLHTPKTNTLMSPHTASPFVSLRKQNSTQTNHDHFTKTAVLNRTITHTLYLQFIALHSQLMQPHVNSENTNRNDIN